MDDEVDNDFFGGFSQTLGEHGYWQVKHQYQQVVGDFRKEQGIYGWGNVILRTNTQSTLKYKLGIGYSDNNNFKHFLYLVEKNEEYFPNFASSALVYRDLELRSNL